MIPNDSTADAALIIAAALLLTFLALVVVITRELRGDGWDVDDQPTTAEQLYRPLQLAASEPTPYVHPRGHRMWHNHTELAEPVPESGCTGCVIEDALLRYEKEQKARRQAEAVDEMDYRCGMMGGDLA